MLQSDTCILFFSQDAKISALGKKKNILPSQTSRVKLIDRLIAKTLKELKNTGLPILHCGYDIQRGSSFGERLANAIEDIFENGYKKVIVVGDDCPSLTPERVLEAQSAISENNMLLGPARDGGVYLIGMHSGHFDKDAFIHLSWESARLQDDFTRYGDALSSSIIWSSVLTDIDRYSDLQAYVREAGSHLIEIKKWILNLIKTSREEIFSPPSIAVLAELVPFGLLRAPPSHR